MEPTRLPRCLTPLMYGSALLTRIEAMRFCNQFVGIRPNIPMRAIASTPRAAEVPKSRCAWPPRSVCRAWAGLAQLVEHVICNHGVAGSIPAAGTTGQPRRNAYAPPLDHIEIAHVAIQVSLQIFANRRFVGPSRRLRFRRRHPEIIQPFDVCARSSSVQLERISHAANLGANHHAKYVSNFFGRAPTCWRHFVCGRTVPRRG